MTGSKSDQKLARRPWWGAAIGGALTLVGARRRVGPKIKPLAVTSVAGLTAISIVCVTKGQISPVYLLDSASGLALIGGWQLAARRPKGRIIS